MEDILLLDAVERYFRAEMSQKEKSFFEEMRKNDPELDQLVVEHIFFLQELERMSALKEFKATTDAVENDLVNEGIISKKHLKGSAKVVFLWNKYRRTIAVAASIAGIVSILTAGLFSVYSDKKVDTTITPLVKETLDDFKKEIKRVEDKVDKSNTTIIPYKPKFEANFNATGFLIDGSGFIATNAHVINKARNIVVENRNGDQFVAEALYVNKLTDLAILKIKDTSFRKIIVPYTIRKGGSRLGEPIYTLGYPREVVVYGEGYLSAKIGHGGDTSSYQVSIPANPGNSGGPVLNKYGEVIGIISSKETNADGVVFAISSKNIYKALDEIRKKDSIHLPLISNLRKLDREHQIEKIEDCVFMVKGN